MGEVKVIPARWYTRGPRTTPVRLIVLHSMESEEMGSTAESCARYFSLTDREASAHVCVDSDSRVRCVSDLDIAYAAPGANHDGLHLEMAGRASQTRAEWLDAYGLKMLDQAAQQIAEWVTQHNIPVRMVDAHDLVFGASGITTHNAVRLAYHKSTHTDPGDGFPTDELLYRVRRLLDPKEDELPDTVRFVKRDNEDPRCYLVIGEKYKMWMADWDALVRNAERLNILPNVDSLDPQKVNDLRTVGEDPG